MRRGAVQTGHTPGRVARITEYRYNSGKQIRNGVLLKLTALMKRAKALGVFIGIFRNPDLSRCTGCRKAAKVGAIAKSFGAWLQIPIKFYRGFNPFHKPVNLRSVTFGGWDRKENC
jgi:hypothetical protein